MIVRNLDIRSNVICVNGTIISIVDYFNITTQTIE